MIQLDYFALFPEHMTNNNVLFMRDSQLWTFWFNWPYICKNMFIGLVGTMSKK